MSPAYIERIIGLLPTSLGSAEIREQIAADILRRSVFSARCLDLDYLKKIREVCTQISEGVINQAEARVALERCLTSMGHTISERPDVNAYGFLALKSSPIWQALGDGVGGFRDTLGNPYPPFCYSSGMAWLDADRETCERFGLDCPDSSALPDVSLSPAESDILEAAQDLGFEDAFNDLLGDLQ